MRKIKVAPSIPTEVEVNEVSQNRAEIIAYPFETGYAVTLAHPLRRLIMGSSIGYAPISIKIEGASHEFDTIRGMHQDVAVLIINLKNIRFKILDENRDRVEVNYSFSGVKDIKASDLANDLVEIIDGDLPVATLNEDAELNFTMTIAKGIGYVPSEDLMSEIPEGAIAIDAFFTPVRRANYKIEHVLVEDNPNYEKIVFDIETDGQIGPVEAFTNALETMNKQLSVFNGVLGIDIQSAPIKASDESELKPFLKTVDTLGLSARSFNSLDRSGIKYLGELVLMSEHEIKNIKNLGKKSLDEINECLESNGFGSEYTLEDSIRNILIKKIKQLKDNQ